MAAKGKYTKELITRIYNLKKTGEYTIFSICETVGISYDTYFAWLKDLSKPEFSDLIKRADEESLQCLAKLARKSLVKRIAGEVFDEVTTEGKTGADGTVISRHMKSVKRYIPPSDTAIIFALKNAESEVFKDRIDLAGTILNKNLDVNDALKKLTDEDLEKLYGIAAKLTIE